MIRSPRQAPAGASARPVTRATAAPAMAMITPTPLRLSSASTPNAAPTSMVINGKASPPTCSFRKARMGGQERQPRATGTRSRRRPRSERKIIVLPCGHLHPLAPQHRQRLDDAGTGGARHDHVVDIAALGGGEG